MPGVSRAGVRAEGIAPLALLSDIVSYLVCRLIRWLRYMSMDGGGHRMLRLTIERRRRGWSQAMLARAAEIDQSNLSRIESGRARPYGVQLIRLARALGWPIGRAEQLLASRSADGQE